LSSAYLPGGLKTGPNRLLEAHNAGEGATQQHDSFFPGRGKGSDLRGWVFAQRKPSKSCSPSLCKRQVLIRDPLILGERRLLAGGWSVPALHAGHTDHAVPIPNPSCCQRGLSLVGKVTSEQAATATFLQSCSFNEKLQNSCQIFICSFF